MKNENMLLMEVSITLALVLPPILAYLSMKYNWRIKDIF